MAKFASTQVLDGGISAIKTGSVRMWLLKAYAFGDPYATVLANRIAEVTMASGDYNIASVGNTRVLTTTAKNNIPVTVDSGTSPNLHIAHTDNASIVLWVTDETTDVQILNGTLVNIPAHTYTRNQPV